MLFPGTHWCYPLCWTFSSMFFFSLFFYLTELMIIHIYIFIYMLFNTNESKLLWFQWKNECKADLLQTEFSIRFSNVLCYVGRKYFFFWKKNKISYCCWWCYCSVELLLSHYSKKRNVVWKARKFELNQTECVTKIII